MMTKAQHNFNPLLSNLVHFLIPAVAILIQGGWRPGWKSSTLNHFQTIIKQSFTLHCKVDMKPLLSVHYICPHLHQVKL